MSKIEDYFNAVLAGSITERIGSDPFFDVFQELNTLNKRLLAIPKEALDCYGIDPDDPTKIKTMDRPRASELNKEYTDSRSRIEQIHELFKRFDPIAAECQKLGFICSPTPYGIDRERMDISNRCVTISRRIDAEAGRLIAGRAAHASNVSQHRKIVPMNEQLADLKSRLKSIEALEVRAAKIAGEEA